MVETLSPSAKPQNKATMGKVYVTEEANTEEVSLINKLKIHTAKPVPTIPSTLM